jgi:hypothetical protein
MPVAANTAAVIPGLMPGIQRDACSGARGWVDPEDKPRDDS